MPDNPRDTLSELEALHDITLPTGATGPTGPVNSSQIDPVPHPAASSKRIGENRPRPSGWFRAFWRWHFYASFLVAPVLLILAVTGLTYLLRFQIEPVLHADLMTVSAPPGAQPASRQSYDQQLAAVRTAYPDAEIISVTEPPALNRTTLFSTTVADQPCDVYVNPWNGRVLGDINPDTTLSGYAVRLHGELMAGPIGDAVIELAACWAVVMAVTGYVLFVRGRRARLRRMATRARGAALRQRHGLVGVVAGIGLVALLITGLPWTGIWGARAQQLATAGGSSLWSDDPGALSNPTSKLDESLPHSHDVPWALGATSVPQSSGTGAGPAATLDTAVDVATREGLAHPMTIALPQEDTGVYSVLGYAFTDPGQERTVHVDRFGAAVVSRYGYDDYPALAKVVAQGIALHEGRRFGAVNFWAAIVFCLAIIFMCITGPVMWWRRRPKGSATVGAPRGRMPVRSTPWLAAALILAGVLLPLFGASLLILLVLDRFLLRRVPRLQNWFATT